MEKIKLVPPTVELPPEELDRRLKAGYALLEPLLLELAEHRLKRMEQEANGDSNG